MTMTIEWAFSYFDIYMKDVNADESSWIEINSKADIDRVGFVDEFITGWGEFPEYIVYPYMPEFYMVPKNQIAETFFRRAYREYESPLNAGNVSDYVISGNCSVCKNRGFFTMSNDESDVMECSCGEKIKIF